MPEIVGAILYALMLALPIAAYLRASRRVESTRLQILAAAVVAGGLAGAVFALVTAALGQGLADSAPYALIGLVCGVGIGGAGLVARSLGRWLASRS